MWIFEPLYQSLYYNAILPLADGIVALAHWMPPGRRLRLYRLAAAVLKAGNRGTGLFLRQH